MKLMKLRMLANSAFAVSAVLLSGNAACGDVYQTGNMTNLTATSDGLMIMLDAGPPTTCAATPYGWMLIPEANKTLVATALAMWLSGKKAATIYSAPYSGGWCILNQINPVF